MLILSRQIISRGFLFRQTYVCNEVMIPECKTMPYNWTRLPNFLAHKTQGFARISFQQYIPLIRTNCSEQLVFFLCALTLPICVDGKNIPHPVLPCRSVCEAVKRECLPSLLRLGSKWPSKQKPYNCSFLPTYNEGVCVSPSSFTNNIAQVRSNTTRQSNGG